MIRDFSLAMMCSAALLGRENDISFELINSLDASQQKQAILSYQVNDLVLGPGQDGKMVQPEGIKVSALLRPNNRSCSI